MYISCCCRMNAPSFALHKCTLPLGSYQMREKCHYLWNKSTPTNYLIVFIFLFAGLGLVKRIKVQLGFFSIKLKCNKLSYGVFVFAATKCNTNRIHSWWLSKFIFVSSDQNKWNKLKLNWRGKKERKKMIYLLWPIRFDYGSSAR